MDQAIYAIWHIFAVAYYAMSGFGDVVLFMFGNPMTTVAMLIIVLILIIFVVSFVCCAGCQFVISWAMKPSKNEQAANTTGNTVHGVQSRRKRN